MRRNEIGSEFWEVPLGSGNNLFPENTKWFISGRSALAYIIADAVKRFGIRSIALPSYCCDSMIIPFLKEKLEVSFYPVFLKNGMLENKVDDRYDAVLVMDYFGYDSKMDYSSYEGIVIRDLTQSINVRKYKDGDYYFGSIRKWCGIYTGGFAYSDLFDNCEYETGQDDAKLQEYIGLRGKAMNEKKKYIMAESEDKSFMELFGKAEEMLDSMDIYGSTDSDISKIKACDFELIKKIRRENAKCLIDGLSDVAIFKELKEDDNPLFVPILVENRDDLKQKLIANNVFCPCHWPVSKVHSLNCDTEKIYKQEISIVCDQRYNIEQMEHILKILKK